MLVYALDIGGSSIKHGLVNIEGSGGTKVQNGKTVHLPSNKFDDLKLEVLKIVAKAIIENRGLTTIGISTTGSVDTKGIVVSAGHFEGYMQVSWEKIIRDKHPEITRVTTANDGRASTWGEYISFSEKHKSHIHVVVGTGVGGGLVYNEELLLGDSGQAGYIGHIKISPNKTITCSCGKTGCVESLASASAIVNHLMDITGDDSVKDFNSVLNLAMNGDDKAIEAIKIGGYWLGIGIGNAMNILNPSAATIGGGVLAGANELAAKIDDDIYFKSVIEGIKYASHRRVFASCDIRKALHGNDGGMIGAAYLSINL